MNKYLKTLLIIGLFLFTACSDKDAPNPGGEAHETTQSIQGKVEKGPFVRGSIVELRTLNADMTATGKSFTATIENNFGTFDFGTITAESQYAKLQAEGYFFNEVLGELSPSTINLNAIVDLTDSRTVNVNILTHLKSERIVTLVKQGSSYKNANAQAQRELLTAFGLQNLALRDASQFSIASGDDAAGALIAISSLILYERSVAETVEFLSQLTAEFSQSGTFRPETKETLRKTRNALNTSFSTIESNVRQRYSDLGIDISVKNLAYYFDWDGNGIAGDELEDEVSLSATELEIPATGGDYTIIINSSKPYYLEYPLSDDDYPSIWEPSYSEEIYEGYPMNGISMTSSLSQNQITLHVDKADFRGTKYSTIPVYNARGENAATIKIKQFGDNTKPSDIPNMGKTAIAYFARAIEDMKAAFGVTRDCELSYIKSNRSIVANDSYVAQSWGAFYSVIGTIINLKEADKEALGVYQDFCNTYLAICYATMLSYWDGVVFFTDRKETSELMNMPRTSKSEMISALLELTEEPLNNLEETTIDFNNINSIFFLSKDVVRLVRAQLFMEKGDYASALSLYETVINSGRYQLESGNTIKYGNNSEVIFYPSLPGSSRATNILNYGCPIFDLKIAYMNAAECAMHVSGANAADKYISFFKSTKDLDATGYSGLGEIQSIMNTTSMSFIVPCIRRSGQSNCIFEIPNNSWYQLIWPIPACELMTNPSLTQNPGY